MHMFDAIAALLITDHAAGRAVQPQERLRVFGITHAGTRILRFLIDGCAIADNGSALGISLQTMRTHVKNMFAKLDCSRQSDLVRNAMQHPIWMLDHSLSLPLLRGVPREAGTLCDDAE
jgi:DNA-binding CsgD family transcriptional regulator